VLVEASIDCSDYGTCGGSSAVFCQLMSSQVYRKRRSVTNVYCVILCVGRRVTTCDVACM
jgi:hypothetical protein